MLKTLCSDMDVFPSYNRCSICAGSSEIDFDCMDENMLAPGNNTQGIKYVILVLSSIGLFRHTATSYTKTNKCKNKVK